MKRVIIALLLTASAALADQALRVDLTKKELARKEHILSVLGTNCNFRGILLIPKLGNQYVFVAPFENLAPKSICVSVGEKDTDNQIYQDVSAATAAASFADGAWRAYMTLLQQQQKKEGITF